MKILIRNANIVNEGSIRKGSVLVENEIIKKISTSDIEVDANTKIIEAEGLYLIPGVIDDQVHFRDPGLTYKADIASESRAAAAGGVTSFMDMPNTKPPAVNKINLEDKFELAAEKSLINYSFYLGATNDNINEISKVDPKKVCGIKVFMGSSTGNMLVDDNKALTSIFAESPIIVTTHCEDESIILENTKKYIDLYGDNIPVKFHPIIRNAEACYKSSSKAVELAQRYNTKLHVLHLTTAKETSLFDECTITDIPRITAEVCVHHLWFTEADYERLGNQIKCNPAIKSLIDRESLRSAVNKGKIAVVATDHAPHTFEEKQNPYINAPSGLPLIQHSLQAMLEMVHENIFDITTVVDRMCHMPARLFDVYKRGFIREGYYADLVLVGNNPNTVSKDNILYKCKWSPFEGYMFKSNILKTWVNGTCVFDNGEIINGTVGKRLVFDR